MEFLVGFDLVGEDAGSVCWFMFFFILSHVRSMGFTSVVGLTAVFVSDLLVFVLFCFFFVFGCFLIECFTSDTLPICRL